jgi:hypothetical protein
VEEYAPALKQELRSMRKPLGDTTRRLLSGTPTTPTSTRTTVLTHCIPATSGHAVEADEAWDGLVQLPEPERALQFDAVLLKALADGLQLVPHLLPLVGGKGQCGETRQNECRRVAPHG